jgi:hypothetical protein
MLDVASVLVGVAGVVVLVALPARAEELAAHGAR